MDEKEFPPEEVANPCGLLSKYYPRDKYLKLVSVNAKNKTYKIETKGIEDEAYSVNFKKNSSQKQWTDVEDPRFINWMKNSSRNRFRKLWGKINDDLKAGKY